MGEEEADVVTRLRDAHLCLDEADRALRNEAADEIERLRETLKITEARLETLERCGS